MLKAIIPLVAIALCASLKIKITNLDDTIDFVTCSASHASQGPYLLSQNKSYWFSADERNYTCVVATSSFKFKAWPAIDNSTKSDYGWYLDKDGIYFGTFDGKKLTLRYGW